MALSANSELHDVRVSDHLWIPMPDGARLGARLWLPAGAHENPAPAILEYIPYRKGDYTAVRDAANHGYLAARGYACVRVDMRGSGESDGILFDEYTDEEVNDGIFVIQWIADQPWCDGNVGMMGISWGGITGLQIAAHNPAPLKAVIAVGASEHRYYDDGGYFMGCLYGQTIGWAAVMFGYNTRPPDPEIVGESWRELWRARLEQTPLYLEKWLTHQHPDGYWWTNSAGEKLDAIRIPVYAVSGHADCWPNTVPRLLENLRAPRKGLMGPWAHRYPHMGVPGPAIGFLSEALRWFDHWLRNIDTGIMEEPDFIVYMQDAVPPKTYYDERPGRWVGEESWPSGRVRPRRYFLNSERLALTPETPFPLSICSPQTVGLASGEYMPWFVFGPAAELPGDQRVEDAGSLVFDILVENTIEILGRPRVILEVASDRAIALAAVRLCDVAPDGASTLVTRGLMNLCHRDGKSTPKSLIPHQCYRVEIELNNVAYAFPPGHRIRLSISTAYWPMAWPPPEPVTLTVYSGVSELILPQRPNGMIEFDAKTFGPPETGPELPAVQVRKPVLQRRLRDNPRGAREYLVDNDNGRVRLTGSGLELGSMDRQYYRIDPEDPLSACAEYEWQWEHGRGDWQVRTHTHMIVTCDRSHFYVSAELKAWEGDTRVCSRDWNQFFPRDHF